jgi:hypothetical protein
VVEAREGPYRKVFSRDMVQSSVRLPQVLTRIQIPCVPNTTEALPLATWRGRSIHGHRMWVIEGRRPTDGMIRMRQRRIRRRQRVGVGQPNSAGCVEVRHRWWGHRARGDVHRTVCVALLGMRAAVRRGRLEAQWGGHALVYPGLRPRVRRVRRAGVGTCSCSCTCDDACTCACAGGPLG